MEQVDTALETDEVIVMLRLHFKPGTAAEVMETMVPGIRLTREEPGNIDFQFFRVKGTEDHFVVFERWKNKAALERHWEEPYTKEALQLFERHLIKPLSEADDVTYLSDLMRLNS